MKQKFNNRGLSLLELIIAFAVLSVVAGITLAIMVRGSDFFASQQKEANLQYRSQISTAQIEQYFADCNSLYVDQYGVHIKCYDDNLAYTIRQGTSTTDAANDITKIYLNSTTLNKSGILSSSLKPTGETAVLCSGIKSFSVTPNNDTPGTAVDYVVLSLEFLDGYTRKQVIACRNYPTYVDAMISAEQEALSLLKKFSDSGGFLKKVKAVCVLNDGYLSVYRTDKYNYVFRLPNEGRGMLYRKDSLANAKKRTPGSDGDFWNKTSVYNNYVSDFHVELVDADSSTKMCSGIKISITVLVNNEAYTVKHTENFSSAIPFYTDESDYITNYLKKQK